MTRPTGERFQAHCAHCFRRYEADTAEVAIRAVEEHEKGCPKGKGKA